MPSSSHQRKNPIFYIEIPISGGVVLSFIHTIMTSFGSHTASKESHTSFNWQSPEREKIQFQLRLWENHCTRSRKYIPEIFTSPVRRQSVVTANEIPIFVCAKRALQSTPTIWICSNWRSSHLWRLLMIHISTIFASEPSIYSLWRRMRR